MELCNFLVVISCTTRVYNLSFLSFFFFFKYFISTVQYLLVQFCSSFNFYVQFWFLESTNAIFLVKFAIFDTCNSLIYTAILE